VPIVLKSGSLNLPEASGPVKACNGIALNFYDVTWRKCDRAGQATDDRMAHEHSILDTLGYKHTLTICNTYCFSTAKICAQTRFIVVSTMYVLFSLGSVGPLAYPHVGYGFYTHTVINIQSVALMHSQHSCRASCEGLSDIPQHFRTVGELKLMQMAYRPLSSHVRVATDIRRVLLMS
jgi:hypothetical protein